MELVKSGKNKIAWAKKNMPVLESIEEEFIRTKPFSGLRVAVSVHVEAKTACLVKALVSGGAEAILTGCNPLSTQDDIAAALADEGIEVHCKHGVDLETYEKDLHKTLEKQPHIVIDDGGDLAQLLHRHPEYRKNLIGGCEETTTGVTRLKSLEADGRLAYPVIAVNDARCKHLFDNRFGTGQSTWTAIMQTTNMIVAGKNVVVAGFGMCGKGVALRAKGMGAHVIVTEIDPVKACEALMEGYDVMTMYDAAKVGDIFVTVTGCLDVITDVHFDVMKAGAVVCNAGHFDVEINLKQLASRATEVYESRNNIQTYVIGEGKEIHVLAEGRLVNLASGDGHPIEIMDMSFALQARSAEFIAKQGKDLDVKVYDVPTYLDDSIAARLLETKSLAIDKLTEVQERYLTTWEL